MAKIIFGPTISDARNRCGDLIYLRGRHGSYVQTYTKPADNPTPARLAQQQITRELVANWQNDITDNQRQAWAEAAAGEQTTTPLAGKHPLSGFNYFMRVNANRLYSATGAFYPNPPLRVYPPELRSVSILTATDSPQSLVIDCDPHPDSSFNVDVFTTPMLSPGVTWPWRKMQKLVTLTASSTFPYEAEADFNAIAIASEPTLAPQWSALLANKKIALLARPVDTATGTPGKKIQTTAIVQGATDAMLSGRPPLVLTL